MRPQYAVFALFGEVQKWYWAGLDAFRALGNQQAQRMPAYQIRYCFGVRNAKVGRVIHDSLIQSGMPVGELQAAVYIHYTKCHLRARCKARATHKKTGLAGNCQASGCCGCARFRFAGSARSSGNISIFMHNRFSSFIWCLFFNLLKFQLLCLLFRIGAERRICLVDAGSLMFATNIQVSPHVSFL